MSHWGCTRRQSTVPSCFLAVWDEQFSSGTYSHTGVLFYNRPIVTEQADCGPNLHYHEPKESIPPLMPFSSGIHQSDKNNHLTSGDSTLPQTFILNVSLESYFCPTDHTAENDAYFKLCLNCQDQLCMPTVAWLPYLSEWRKMKGRSHKENGKRSDASPTPTPPSRS